MYQVLRLFIATVVAAAVAYFATAVLSPDLQSWAEGNLGQTARLIAILASLFVVFLAAVWLVDRFAYLRARYWLKRLRELDGDPLPTSLRPFHWTLENFVRWKERVGKLTEDFNVRLKGKPPDIWLPQLTSRYLEKADLR